MRKRALKAETGAETHRAGLRVESATVNHEFSMPKTESTPTLRFAMPESVDNGRTKHDRMATQLQSAAASAGEHLRKIPGPFARLELEKELVGVRAARLLDIHEAMESAAQQAAKLNLMPGLDALQKEMARRRDLVDTPTGLAMQAAMKQFQTMNALSPRALEVPALKALHEDLKRTTILAPPWSQETREKAERLRAAYRFPALRELEKQVSTTALLQTRFLTPPEIQEPMAAIRARSQGVFARVRMPTMESLLARVGGSRFPDTFREQVRRIESLLGPDIEALASAGFERRIATAAATVSAIAVLPVEIPAAEDGEDSLEALVVRLEQGLHATQSFLAEQTDLTTTEQKSVAIVVQVLVSYLISKLIDLLILMVK